MTATETPAPARPEQAYTITLTPAEHEALVATVSRADSPGRDLEGPLAGAFDKLRTALPHAAAAPHMRADWDGAVWVVATFPRGYPGRITDLELTDTEPQWDLTENRQRAWLGNVNGGDSVPWAPAEACVIDGTPVDPETGLCLCSCQPADREQWTAGGNPPYQCGEVADDGLWQHMRDVHGWVMTAFARDDHQILRAAHRVALGQAGRDPAAAEAEEEAERRSPQAWADWQDANPGA